MSIYEFSNYKKFVIDEVRKRPNRGHGQFSKIAQALGIHTTMVTHIFKGDLHLSSEQCLALADFLGLNELETEYFETLVLSNRAGDKRTQEYYQKKIAGLRERALSLKQRIQIKNSLDTRDQATFYSSCINGVINLMTAIPQYQNRIAIAQELKLSQSKVNRVIEFLISCGLCKEESGKLTHSGVSTYVEAESPLVSRHHENWRLKAISHFDRLDSKELAYTNPVVISEKDFLKIREELVELIKRFNQVTGPSPCETVACLNIDWFYVLTGH